MLTTTDINLAAECLLKTADGDLYPDWEFQTLMGVDRFEMRQAAKLMRDGLTADTGWIVCNAVNNLFGYPHSEDSRNLFAADVGATLEELWSLLDKVQAMPPPVDFL